MSDLQQKSTLDDPGCDLNRRQLKALETLLTESTLGEAAKAAGVNERTLLRWRKDPVFVAELRRRRTQLTEHTLTRLQGVSTKAVGALVEALDGDVVTAKVAAARALLDFMFRGVEHLDLSERLEEVEAALGQQGPALKVRGSRAG